MGAHNVTSVWGIETSRTPEPAGQLDNGRAPDSGEILLQNLWWLLAAERGRCLLLSGINCSIKIHIYTLACMHAQTHRYIHTYKKTLKKQHFKKIKFTRNIFLFLNLVIIVQLQKI